MSPSPLHPSFDPTSYTSDDPCTLEQQQQEQIASFEYAIEMELAQLRSLDASKQQLEQFTSLLLETRNEQRETRTLLARVLDILGTAA